MRKGRYDFRDGREARRSALRRVLMAICFAGCAATVAQVSGPIRVVSAASVSSSGTSEELRCSSAGYTDSGNHKLLSKCYTTAGFGALAGTTQTYARSTSAPRHLFHGVAYYASGSATLNIDNCDNGTGNFTTYYGPQSTSAWGSIPAQSFVTLNPCDSGATWANYSSTVITNITSAHACWQPSQAWQLDNGSDSVDTSRVGGTGANAQYCWNGLVSKSAADAMSWPTDWYPGGAQFVAHECLGISYQGSADTTPVGGSFSITTTGTPTAGMVIEAQLRAGGAWQTVTPVPGTWSTTVTGSPLPMGGVTLRCSSTASATLVYATPATSSSATWPLSAAPVYSPCMSVTVTWPIPQTVESGGSATWRFQAAAGIGPVTVKYTKADPDANNGFPLASATWTTATGLSSVTGVFDVSVTVSSLYSGLTSQVYWRCVDSSGVHTERQWGAAFSYGQLAAEPSEDDCFASTGLGISPSSWVPGLVRGLACVLRTLFVPSQASIDGFQDAIGSALEKAPISFIAEGVAIVGNLFDNLTEALALGSHYPCAVSGFGMPTGYDGEEVSVATDSYACAADMPESLLVVRAIETWLFWIGFVWSILSAVLAVLG